MGSFGVAANAAVVVDNLVKPGDQLGTGTEVGKQLEEASKKAFGSVDGTKLAKLVIPTSTEKSVVTGERPRRPNLKFR